MQDVDERGDNERHNQNTATGFDCWRNQKQDCSNKLDRSNCHDQHVRQVRVLEGWRKQKTAALVSEYQA